MPITLFGAIPVPLALKILWIIPSAMVFRTLRASRSFFNSDRAAGGVDVGDSKATMV